MPETDTEITPEEEAQTTPQLASGAYEIIRNRLLQHADSLQQRLGQLNTARKDTFGAIEARLLNTARVTTSNNCIPRDMDALGSRFLFGYNVQLGLRSEMTTGDVFAAYEFSGDTFRETALPQLLGDPQFERDFADLYKYYKGTSFAKFSILGNHLYMIFRVGKTASDIKAFKWHIEENGALRYIDNRSDHEFSFPSKYDFEWTRATRDMHRGGTHPHISIEDRIFVETIGGDLTVKVEDNTASGQGIYAELVDNADQTLDDAEIYYATVGSLILLKILPYQEETWRYLVYAEKVQQVVRIDAIETACILLPDDHGIIFPDGYYLQTGEYKRFDHNQNDLLFERRIQSPNGEDYLYIFYNRLSGVYVLLPYNLIEQEIATPIICHGYSLFDDGKLVYFRAREEPTKVHTLQVWQTPFVGPNYEQPVQNETFLYKIGNRDIVRAMAQCTAIINLIQRDEIYGSLYLDLLRLSTDALDAYFWLDNEEAYNLKEPLAAIREAASGAIEEFEKVKRIKAETAAKIDAVTAAIDEIFSTIKRERFETVDHFVKALASLRTSRGQAIELKELRYTDLPHIEALEARIQEESERLAGKTIEFLLGEDALAPYENRVATHKAEIEDITTVAQARTVGEGIDQTASELEMLIDVTGNLKIDDATQRTAIIDAISDVYATLNQVRAGLKNRRDSLARHEGKAEFASQIKLINQAVINYLDVCDTVERCEEYLTKLMVQIEELEGKFADLDDYVEELTGKREEIYTAFENRKLQLTERRTKRIDALLRSAERILKGIRTRAESLEEISEIHGYFAGDLMVEKVRDIVNEMGDLGDTVKAGDIQTRLKTIREDAVRQLKDRKELFVGGENVIKFGRHRFSVNTQPLDLTLVRRDDAMYLHLSGTDFFEQITDEAFLATRPVWDQELVSENRDIYRAEYLAYQLLQGLGQDGRPTLTEADALDDAARLTLVRTFMGPRYSEGYTKGVHDQDAAILFAALVSMRNSIGLLRYHTQARALAEVFWKWVPGNGEKGRTLAKLRGFGAIRRHFPADAEQQEYIAELADWLHTFVTETALFSDTLVPEAAGYLFHMLTGEGNPTISQEAGDLLGAFANKMEALGADKELNASLQKLTGDVTDGFSLLREWLTAFANQQSFDLAAVDEAAALLYTGRFDRAHVSPAHTKASLTGFTGNHSRVVEGRYALDYNDFMLRLATFQQESVPKFYAFLEMKKARVEESRQAMKLDEFKPRVLSSFVRNQLIDKVYLPLVGDNLAKQIGVVGEETRTDRMGMLLLISPPGYGKTTLMEYIANRLGLTFMKINGPAIGHGVTAIDPADAPNAAAKEELKKLNLALEMGDNVMIYVDDIQHCNPEFLQKFISLCDAQRKIEGVWKGRTRTYDLRGKKVCVVMAGNPYTESGEAFKIPDMLANRADTYNLGDIIGENADSFKLSYLENALTSNPVLGKLASRSQKDVLAVARIAATGNQDGVELEGGYGAEELREYVTVMEKLLRIRDVVLSVNGAYIHSAAQSDDYRTEPPFKLQGSYRNMNRMAEKIVPLMNDAEVEGLIHSHYENEAQTLTTGAEANLLKFKELSSTMQEEEVARWTNIKKTFARNLGLRAAGGDDKISLVVSQLVRFADGLDSVKEAIEANAEHGPAEMALTPETLTALSAALASLTPQQGTQQLSLDPSTLANLEKMLATQTPEQSASSALPTQIEVVNKVPRGILLVLRQQFKLMQQWMKPILEESTANSQRLDDLKETIASVSTSYENLIGRMSKGDTLLLSEKPRRKKRRDADKSK